MRRQEAGGRRQRTEGRSEELFPPASPAPPAPPTSPAPLLFLPLSSLAPLTELTTDKLSRPQLFKGIALFTPGGDLIYCIDPNKQGRWHLHLCTALQEILDLPEPPHFLVPCYTATIDHWLDPHSQQVRTFAEAYPAVIRHQAVLNAIFGTELTWQTAPWQEGLCDRMVLSTYRSSFPQLWEDHDLIVNLDVSEPAPKYRPPVIAARKVQLKNQCYVLRLFVAGHSANTERILQNLHELLERSLGYPYTMKVVDVLTNPEQAEIDQVTATPTLVKVWPHPIRRIVGDLDNAEKILQMLGATEKI